MIIYNIQTIFKESEFESIPSKFWVADTHKQMPAASSSVKVYLLVTSINLFILKSSATLDLFIPVFIYLLFPSKRLVKHRNPYFFRNWKYLKGGRVVFVCLFITLRYWLGHRVRRYRSSRVRPTAWVSLKKKQFNPLPLILILF